MYSIKIVILRRDQTDHVVYDEPWVSKDGKLKEFDTLAKASFMAGCALTGFIQEFDRYDTEEYLPTVWVMQYGVKVVEFNW